MSSAVVTTWESLGSIFSASVEDASGSIGSGNDIVETGSDADNLWSLSGGRLGEPTITDGSSSEIYIKRTFGDSTKARGVVVAGASLPSGTTVRLYSDFSTGGSDLAQTLVKSDSADLWLGHGFAHTAETAWNDDSTNWMVRITLPSPQEIEIPFVGLSSITGNFLAADVSNPGVLKGFSWLPVSNTTEVSGRAGNRWTREHPNTYEQRVTMNAVHEDSVIEGLYGQLEGTGYHDPVLTLLDLDDLTKYGSACFGRLRELSPFGMGGGGPAWSLRFTVENAR